MAPAPLVPQFARLAGQVQAVAMKIDSIPLGRVITINGHKFVKVRNDLVKGSQFVAMGKVSFPCLSNQFDGMEMQAFTTDDCNCLATPTGDGYTLAGIMRDSRDGKTYEIRKFADGKCWMVDNLRYGGVTDACASKTIFSGGGSVTASDVFGTGTYGDCRSNPGVATYGYLYNWQAAMQDASAYSGILYQPAQPTQGICPVGWHIPSGDVTGEFQALHVAAGSPATGFWQAAGPWKGTFSGRANASGSLGNQGANGRYWSSTLASAGYAYHLFVDGSMVAPADDTNKYYGIAVRCIKN